MFLLGSPRFPILPFLLCFLPPCFPTHYLSVDGVLCIQSIQSPRRIVAPIPSWYWCLLPSLVRSAPQIPSVLPLHAYTIPSCAVPFGLFTFSHFFPSGTLSVPGRSLAGVNHELLCPTYPPEFKSATTKTRSKSSIKIDADIDSYEASYLKSDDYTTHVGARRPIGDFLEERIYHANSCG